MENQENLIYWLQQKLDWVKLDNGTHSSEYLLGFLIGVVKQTQEELKQVKQAYTIHQRIFIV